MNEARLRFLEEEVTAVLLVEDDIDHANLIKMFLRRSTTASFSVEIATNLTDALRKLKEDDFDIILLDLSLPESDGLNTFYSLHARTPHIPIVVLSGLDDEYVAIEAVRGGAQDYLVKGQSDHNLILRSIRYALERKRAEEALRSSEEHFRQLIEHSNDLIGMINSDGQFTYASPSHQRVLGYPPADLIGRRIVELIHPDDHSTVERTVALCTQSEKQFSLDYRMCDSNGHWHVFESAIRMIPDPEHGPGLVINAHDVTDRVSSQMELSKAYNETLEGWSHALDLRDKETVGHSRRVAEMAVQLAASMGIDGDDLEHIRRGCLLHDIGKMAIPDSILHKSEDLTDEEWAMMRRHPEYAYEMLAPIDFLRPAMDIPYCHHEKWDGSGYPRGLAGDDIPLSARIFAVIDVWDALTSNRPYSEPWTPEAAKEYIQEQAGRHFDPAVVSKFVEIV